MPELPEVETMRTQLSKFIVGSKITNVIFKTKSYELPTKNLIGSTVLKVRRYAKVTSIDLSSDYSILTHVKLTGQYIYRGPNLKDKSELSKKVVGGLGGPHTHIIFEFSDGGKLYYNDIRKFGWVRLVKTEEVEKEKFIKNLGPEPHIAKGFSGAVLTKEYFNKLLSKSKRNIKVLLMDQAKIGGVGNIYANDALYLAKISPKRTANTLTEDEQNKLYNAIEFVLKEGLKYGGASELAFVTPDGKEGGYQKHTLVYGREKEPCNNLACRQAGVRIEKFFLGGRGTYICPICQK